MKKSNLAFEDLEGEKMGDCRLVYLSRFRGDVRLPGVALPAATDGDNDQNTSPVNLACSHLITIGEPMDIEASGEQQLPSQQSCLTMRPTRDFLRASKQRAGGSEATLVGRTIGSDGQRSRCGAASISSQVNSRSVARAQARSSTPSSFFHLSSSDSSWQVYWSLMRII